MIDILKRYENEYCVLSTTPKKMFEELAEHNYELRDKLVGEYTIEYIYRKGSKHIRIVVNYLTFTMRGMYVNGSI